MSETGFRASVTDHPSGLGTMPNECPEVTTRMVHTFSIAGLCPVSHNPLPGSTLSIRYRMIGCLLEVYALKQYIEAYRGGHPTNGVRNMEAMVQTIARDCAAALGVKVTVHARLLLSPGQEMVLVATAHPPCASGWAHTCPLG